MKEKGRLRASFGPLHQLVKELCAVLHGLLPVVGMRVHTRERAGKGELTLVYFLQRQEDLPPPEFLHALVEALRRTPFTADYKVVQYKKDDYRHQYAAAFYITLTYRLRSGTGCK